MAIPPVGVENEMTAVVGPRRIELPCGIARQRNRVGVREIDDPDIGRLRALDQGHRQASSVATQIQRRIPGEPAHCSHRSTVPVAPGQSLIRQDRSTGVSREHARFRCRKRGESIPGVERRLRHHGEGRAGHATFRCVETLRDETPATQEEQVPRGIASVRFIASERDGGRAGELVPGAAARSSVAV
jgi:hypothetical protein